MKAIGKLDDDNGAFAWRSQQTPDDSATCLTANLAKDDFHAPKLA